MFEIGNSLREARLRQSLDLPDAEQATKIRAKYLKALEQEQFELLPAQTYVKGFLRSYAEYLGLDGQLYVDEYNSRYVTGEEEPTLRPRRSAAGRGRQRGVESNVVLVALGGIAAVTALFIAAWRFGGGDNQQTIPSIGRTQTTTRVQAQKKPPRAAKPTTAHLVLTAKRGDCWLAVHLGSATGKQVFAGTLEQGKSLPLTAKRLWINAGAPENLDVKLNGKRKQFPAGAPSVVVVTKNGIAHTSV